MLLKYIDRLYKHYQRGNAPKIPIALIHSNHGKNHAVQNQRNQRSQATKYGLPDFIGANNNTLLWGTLKPKILATKTWKESRNPSTKGNLTAVKVVYKTSFLRIICILTFFVMVQTLIKLPSDITWNNSFANK